MGESAATAVVSIQQAEDGSTTDSKDVQFEAFQLSDQAVKLWQAGWFQPHDKPTGGSCTLRDPRVGARFQIASKLRSWACDLVVKLTELKHCFLLAIALELCSKNAV